MLGRTAEGLGAENLRVRLVDRSLEGGCRDVPVEDPAVLVIEDRRFDAAAEQGLGLAHEVLVERVLACDEDGEALPPAAGPAPLLAEARNGAGEADRDHRVEGADVDPELERVRRADAEELAREEPLLDLAPLRRRVAGAIGREGGGIADAGRP